MAQNHVQEGKVMTWTNPGPAAVASGDVVMVGLIGGVALGDIAAGAIGELAIAEVFELPKEAALVVTQGDQLYYDPVTFSVDADVANVAIGKAFADAAALDATVLVLLNV